MEEQFHKINQKSQVMAMSPYLKQVASALVSPILYYFRTVHFTSTYQPKEVKEGIFQLFQKMFSNRKYIFSDINGKSLLVFYDMAHCWPVER